MTATATVSRASQSWRALTLAGSVGAAALTAHTAVNLRLLRAPDPQPPPVAELVSVLLPVRDEEARVGACLRSILEQVDVPRLQVLILDDGSSDGTAGEVGRVAAGDDRVRLTRGGDGALPAGWLGKPYACHRLAAQADGAVLVFVDADVVLAPHAVAATVHLLRGNRLDLVSPYPRQLAGTPAERLVQPLLQWSWLTTLPLALAERSARESLSAANGQLLAIDAGAYARCGGHQGVRTEVLDDVALVRALKRVGGRGGVVDGTTLATCRMYRDWASLREGYTKSLWSAFGSPGGAAAVMAALGLLYVVPPAAALAGSRIGVAGYAAGVLGRHLVARRTGARSVPDAFAHPASIALLGFLTGQSWRRHRVGALRWKGRPIG